MKNIQRIIIQLKTGEERIDAGSEVQSCAQYRSGERT
jgi:hypothetical protein